MKRWSTFSDPWSEEGNQEENVRDDDDDDDDEIMVESEAPAKNVLQSKSNQTPTEGHEQPPQSASSPRQTVSDAADLSVEQPRFRDSYRSSLGLTQVIADMPDPPSTSGIQSQCLSFSLGDTSSAIDDTRRACSASWQEGTSRDNAFEAVAHRQGTQHCQSVANSNKVSPALSAASTTTEHSPPQSQSPVREEEAHERQIIPLDMLERHEVQLFAAVESLMKTQAALQATRQALMEAMDSYSSLKTHLQGEELRVDSNDSQLTVQHQSGICTDNSREEKQISVVGTSPHVWTAVCSRPAIPPRPHKLLWEDTSNESDLSSRSRAASCSAGQPELHRIVTAFALGPGEERSHWSSTTTEDDDENGATGTFSLESCDNASTQVTDAAQLENRTLRHFSSRDDFESALARLEADTVIPAGMIDDTGEFLQLGHGVPSGCVRLVAIDSLSDMTSQWDSADGNSRSSGCHHFKQSPLQRISEEAEQEEGVAGVSDIAEKNAIAQEEVSSSIEVVETKEPPEDPLRTPTALQKHQQLPSTPKKSLFSVSLLISDEDPRETQRSPCESTPTGTRVLGDMIQQQLSKERGDAQPFEDEVEHSNSAHSSSTDLEETATASRALSRPSRGGHLHNLAQICKSRLSPMAQVAVLNTSRDLSGGSSNATSCEIKSFDSVSSAPSPIDQKLGPVIHRDQSFNFSEDQDDDIASVGDERDSRDDRVGTPSPPPRSSYSSKASTSRGRLWARPSKENLLSIDVVRANKRTGRSPIDVVVEQSQTPLTGSSGSLAASKARECDATRNEHFAVEESDVHKERDRSPVRRLSKSSVWLGKKLTRAKSVVGRHQEVDAQSSPRSLPTSVSAELARSNDELHEGNHEDCEEPSVATPRSFRVVRLPELLKMYKSRSRSNSTASLNDLVATAEGDGMLRPKRTATTETIQTIKPTSDVAAGVNDPDEPLPFSPARSEPMEELIPTVAPQRAEQHPHSSSPRSLRQRIRQSFGTVGQKRGCHEEVMFEKRKAESGSEDDDTLRTSLDAVQPNTEGRGRRSQADLQTKGTAKCSIAPDSERRKAVSSDVGRNVGIISRASAAYCPSPALSLSALPTTAGNRSSTLFSLPLALQQSPSATDDDAVSTGLLDASRIGEDPARVTSNAATSTKFTNECSACQGPAKSPDTEASVCTSVARRLPDPTVAQKAGRSSCASTVKRATDAASLQRSVARELRGGHGGTAELPSSTLAAGVKLHTSIQTRISSPVPHESSAGINTDGVTQQRSSSPLSVPDCTYATPTKQKLQDSVPTHRQAQQKSLYFDSSGLSPWGAASVSSETSTPGGPWNQGREALNQWLIEEAQARRYFEWSDGSCQADEKR
ncbi:unnamed protein product [Jaminaea pallidilutea]